MPSGPESLVGDPAYHTEFTRARELLLLHPGRWRVIYHYDGDGIASASSASPALRRLGYGVQATSFQGVQPFRHGGDPAATAGPVWVVNTGAHSDRPVRPAPAPGADPRPSRFPDPEAARHLPDHVAFVNPLDWGVDGMSEMCAATLTWLYTILLDPRNWDNAPWGISGAIADRQHVGGFRGPNAWLMEEALRRDLLARGPRLGLSGPTLASALARSIDPSLRGLSNHPEAVTPFIKGLGIDPTKAPGALSSLENGRLGEALMAHLSEQGVRPEFIEERSGGTAGASRASGSRRRSSPICRTRPVSSGQPGLGIALAFGDPGALQQAREAEEGWRSGILAGLKRLEEGAAKPMRAIQWFEERGERARGHAARTRHELPVGPAATGCSREAAGPIPWCASAAAARCGSSSRGLDLAGALRDAAASVGGEGGGHRVAARGDRAGRPLAGVPGGGRPDHPRPARPEGGRGAVSWTPRPPSAPPPVTGPGQGAAPQAGNPPRLHRLRHERHRRARAARGARRPETGAPPHPLCDVGERRHPRQAVPARAPAPSVRCCGKTHPARRHGRLRHARADGPGLQPALPAHRRPGQLRLDRRRHRRRHAVHRGAALPARRGDAARHREGHGGLAGQLRRLAERAAPPPRQGTEPARERLGRHCRRDGDQHAAAQPFGGVRRAAAALGEGGRLAR